MDEGKVKYEDKEKRHTSSWSHAGLTAINWLGHLLAIGIIISITFLVSYHFHIWSIYPSGNDSGSHIFRALIVSKYFPNFSWIHVWASGMPLFLVYPVIPYFIVNLIHIFTNASLELAITVVSLLSIATVGISAYFIVRTLVKDSFFLALAAGVIYVVAPNSYNSAFIGGTFARGAGLAFVGLSILFAIIYVKKRQENKKTNLAYVLLIIFLVLTFLFHHMQGAFVVAMITPLLLLSENKLLKRILLPVKVFVPVLVIISFYLVGVKLYPQYTSPWQNEFWDIVIENSVPFSNIFYLLPKNLGYVKEVFFTIPPVIGYLALVLTSLTLIFHWKKLRENVLWFKIIFWLLFLICVALIYEFALIGWPFPYRFFGSPTEMLPYLVLFFVILIGLSARLLLGKWLSIPLGIVLVAGSLWWVNSQLPLAEGDSYFNPDNVQASKLQREPVLTSIFDPNPIDFNYRFGNDDDGRLGFEFNLRYLKIPQTRGFFSSGYLGFDYFIYFYQSVWDWIDNYKENDFNFDWWAIKIFIAPDKTEAGIKNKFNGREEKYVYLGREYGSDYFEFSESAPIMSSTSAPTVLVISKERINYDSVFRALAQTNLNSRVIIPVRFTHPLDKIDPEELNKFDLVFLYGYEIQNPKSVKKLKKYVEEGGGLFIETNKFIDEERIFSDILPVSGISNTEYGKQWQLTKGSLGKKVLEDIDLGGFGPAIFDKSPWGVGVAEDINDKAEVFLLEAGKPILVGQDIGKGRVVWSGMNLPYHIDTYKTSIEADMLGEIFFWAMNRRPTKSELINGTYSENGDTLQFETDTYQVKLPNPEEWIVTLKDPAQGVLFKESYFVDWTARVKEGGKWKKAEIYKAGPDFMYIPLKGISASEVVFDFQRSFAEKFAFVLSIITLVLLVIYAINDSIFKKILQKIKIKLYMPTDIKEWWDKE